MDFDNGDSPGKFFASLVKELKNIAISNIKYFRDGKQSHEAKFHTAFCLLLEYLDLGIEPCYREIYKRVHEFDASPQEKGNGYRSLLRIVQKCCLHLLQISRHISMNREAMLFRRQFYTKELEAYVATLGQLRACLYYAQKLMTYCQPGSLFADEDSLDDAVAEQLMTDVEMLSQDCFYGRCLGFQFCESMQRPLQVVAIAMASFSEGYQENSQIMKVATSLFNSPKYLMNPEVRAQQVVNVTRTADIQFCKAFWSITESEIMHQLPSLVCPNVQVDEVFHLGPDTFEMASVNGDDITINPPCAHTGPASVQVRLLSYQLREGQEQHIRPSRSPGAKTPTQKAPLARGLLIHCHGGGFVAQSSRSHEVYLRHWAKDLDVPILSVDYSLAPESPFPRALEECFYAYAWAVHNCKKLGSTGDVILMAGDSAGGNLVVSTAMRAASFNIRSPDGILAVYTPVLVRYTPSPARLLCLMDPLLPAGILSRCLAAYAGVSDELSSQLAASVNCHIESSAATLNMSSQETSEPDWVLIGQDPAARVNTTLAGSRRKQNIQLSGSSSMTSLERSNSQEEVEIYSRPKTAVASMASTVADAKDRIMSYVGTYSQLLATSFSGWTVIGPQKVSPEVSSPGEGSLSKELGQGRREDSVETASFYTPMTSPDEGQDSLVSCEMMTGSSPDDGPDIGFTSCPSPSNKLVPEARATFSLENISPEKKERTNVDEVQSGIVRLANESSSIFASCENFAPVVMEGSENQVPGTLHHLSSDNLQTLPGHAVLNGPPTSNMSAVHIRSETSDAPAGENSVNSRADPGDHVICMPLLSKEKADLLRQEVDNSVFAEEHDTDDQYLTGEDSELNVYEILGQENQSGIVTVHVEGKIALPPRNLGEENSDAISSSVSAVLVAERSNATGAVNLEEKLQRSKDTEVTKAECSKEKLIYKTSEKSYAQICQKEKHFKTEGVPDSKSDLKLSIDNLSLDSGCLSDDPVRPGPSIMSTSISNDFSSVIDSTVSPSHLRRSHLHLDLQPKRLQQYLPRSASTPLFRDPAGCSSYSPSMSPSDFKRERHLAQSPLHAIRHIPIVKNPYMSPLLAPDSLLEGLPHISLVACHLDPLIDDSVMFTQRLRSMGKSVDLIILDDLPHGFLNFSLVSQDAKHGSDVCVQKLKKMLSIP